MARNDINASVGLDSTRFKAGLASARKGVNSFASFAMSKFALIGGAAGIGGLATSAINLGSKISDLAVQLRIGSTELQVFQDAAREAGVSSSILERGLRNVNLRSEEAASGNKRYSEAIERLGLDLNKFLSLSTDEKFIAIAEAQAKATNQSEAYRDVAVILGERAGPQLQEVLQRIAKDGYGAMEKAARRAGQVMDKDTVAKMDKAADKIETLKTALKIFAAEAIVRIGGWFKIFNNFHSIVPDIISHAAGVVTQAIIAIANSVGSVIQPVLLGLESIGKGFVALGQAATGNLGKAKETIKDAGESGKKAFDELVNIPGEIGDSFTQFTRHAKSEMNSLKSSLGERIGNIGEGWSDMLGMVKEESKETGEAIKTNLSLDANDTESSSKKDLAKDRRERLKTLEEQIRQIKLAALREETRGNEKNVQSLNKRLELAQRIVKIMRQTGADQRTATIAANKQLGYGVKAKTGPGSGIQVGHISTGQIGDNMRLLRNGRSHQQMFGLGWGPMDQAAQSAQSPAGKTPEEATAQATTNMAQDIKVIANEITGN